MPDKPVIKMVTGAEPHRENEYPVIHQVGYEGVTRIDYELQNFGTYGIGLYHVYKGVALYSTMTQTNVAEVYYFPPEAAPD